METLFSHQRQVLFLFGQIPYFNLNRLEKLDRSEKPDIAAELSIDDMAKMVGEMIEAHGPYMAMYK